jgi:hypothetical protein
MAAGALASGLAALAALSLPAASRLSRNSMTSALVIRPSRPLPRISAGSSSCSSTRRRTAGLRRPAALPGSAVSSSSSSGDSSAAASCAGAALALAPSPSSRIARMSPAVTVVPSEILISFRIPSAGAGTSRTTLSVSRSARFSSRLTLSPGDLCQATSVASATDSGSWGTLTSMVMRSSWWLSCESGDDRRDQRR